MFLSILTTYASGRTSSLVIATLIALCYVAAASGHWAWSMLPDAALLGLYIARPSLPLLAFVLLLVAIRHTPTLAREVATMFQLHTFEGWTIRAVVFALPALRMYSSHASTPAATAATAASAANVPPLVTSDNHQSPVTSQPRAPLSPAQWLGAVNDDRTKPHLGVIGPTTLGKSTLVCAALGRRAGKVVITTPKSKEEDDWAGADAHRMQIDLTTRRSDWSSIAKAIDDVHFEMLRRKAQGDTRSDQLTLVIDDYNTTLSYTPKQTRDQVLDLWRMGASSQVRVIVAATDVNAKSWGIEGQRDLVDNLIFMRVEDGRRWSLGRLDPNGRLVDPQACDTRPLLTLAGETVLAGREWVAPPMPAAPGVLPPPAEGLLGDLLGTGVRVGAGGAPPVGADQTQTQTPANAEADKRIAMYMEWRAAGIKKEQARAIRHSGGAGLDDSEWAEADKRIKQTANGTN